MALSGLAPCFDVVGRRKPSIASPAGLFASPHTKRRIRGARNHTKRFRRFRRFRGFRRFREFRRFRSFRRFRRSRAGAEEAGMKGWRERAADIFTKHGEIAAKMKSAPGPLMFSYNVPMRGD